MTEPPKPKSSSRGKILALVFVALAIALGYFVRDCGFGAGIGGQPGGGPKSPETAPETTPSPAERPAGPVSVVVRGDRCVVDGAAPELCTTACENIARRSTPETPVNVDAGAGQQAAVDGLRRCLVTKGYRAVRIDAEAPGVTP